MLPPTPETIFRTADSSNTFQRHEPNNFESSYCARPQMAWQMYEQLLRIASNRQKQQCADNEQIDKKRVWLAAFTGPSLTYSPGVAAGVAEPI